MEGGSFKYEEQCCKSVLRHACLKIVEVGGNSFFIGVYLRGEGQERGLSWKDLEDCK